MIKLVDNKLQSELLDSSGILGEKTIKEYNYIKFKNDFEEIIDILATNILVHSLYQEMLKYEVTEDLEFKIFVDEEMKDYSLAYDFKTGKSYESIVDNSILSIDRAAYDASIELCIILLRRVKRSFDKLNEVEKFIIKFLEFDEFKLTDEELIERLMTYKNFYYMCKKSAFIKMGLQLNINQLKISNDDEELRYSVNQDMIGKIWEKVRKSLE